MNDKAARRASPSCSQSFADEAQRRCDVIAAGLATETTDFETMRAEAHALKGTASVVGLRRLAELAGLMESDLAEAKKTGIDPRRPRPTRSPTPPRPSPRAPPPPPRAKRSPPTSAAPSPSSSAPEPPISRYARACGAVAQLVRAADS